MYIVGLSILILLVTKYIINKKLKKYTTKIDNLIEEKPSINTSGVYWDREKNKPIGLTLYDNVEKLKSEETVCTEEIEDKYRNLFNE